MSWMEARVARAFGVHPSHRQRLARLVMQQGAGQASALEMVVELIDTIVSPVPIPALLAGLPDSTPPRTPRPRSTRYPTRRRTRCTRLRRVGHIDSQQARGPDLHRRAGLAAP